MFKQLTFYFYTFLVILTAHRCFVSSGDAPADSLVTNRYGAADSNNAAAPHIEKLPPSSQSHHYTQQVSGPAAAAAHHGNVGGNNVAVPPNYHSPPPPPSPGSGGHIEKRNSYNLLSEAMTQAVSNEFSSLGSGSADGACHLDDLECYTNSVQDRLGMEAIRTLHRQLDDDDNGNIDLSESDDFLREELKYDSGYEKRQKAFHFNDDMHISVKELWEAWLRSEVHNWTIEQTTDWLAQSVQLPQYVELFKLHKVTGAALPRLAVNNMHYVGNVLGIKDPIHKQKIALKAMDVVLFGPPRETGTRWKDYILVTLLLSAIIGCWYAYQQNKNAKRHLRRMAQDMEGLQRAEQSLQEMQKELERARMEQESVETEKMDLERRLKEAPLLTSSSSDLEVQQLKKEIEMLRNELSRAEIELVDNCWTPPPQLQSWLQYTYELESKNHLKKRMSAERQLQSAREACEKLRKKRSSLVGAFVSTHGKSIDDVDRSIVEARNSLSEVTNELQERLHRWKQIETCLGFNIVNNNGLPYLESVLYGRNGGVGSTVPSKGSRGRITSSTDDLDDDSVQGIFDSYTRTSALINSGSVPSVSNAMNNAALRGDDSSSDEGGGAIDAISNVQFYLGSVPPSQAILNAPIPPERPTRTSHLLTGPESQQINSNASPVAVSTVGNHINATNLTPASPTAALLHHNNAQYPNYLLNDSLQNVVATTNDKRHSPSVSSESSVTVPPRNKKHNVSIEVGTAQSGTAGRAPLPPPPTFYDPKAPTWCQWRSTRISHDNSPCNISNNSSSNSSNNYSAESEIQSLPPQVAILARRWLSNTARLANNRRHQRLRPCNQLHQPLSQTPTTEELNLENYLIGGYIRNELATADMDMETRSSKSNRSSRSNSPITAATTATTTATQNSVMEPMAQQSLNNCHVFPLNHSSNSKISQERLVMLQSNRPPMLRRHTIIPNWKNIPPPIQFRSRTPSASTATTALKNDDEGYVSLSEVAKNLQQHKHTAAVTASTITPQHHPVLPRRNLNSSQSDGCINSS